VIATAYVTATSPFEAAREVEILPKKHRSRRLHGHSFLARVRAKLDGELWADFPGDEPNFLRRRLHDCVRAFDYRYLNEIVSIPTDENLARYIIARVVDIPGVDMVGVQSTHDAGVDLDERNRAHVWRKFRFEAAHKLPNVPEGHQCGRMHGHSFEVILHANQQIDTKDMAVDFDTLIARWQPLHDELQHSCLNEIKGLENPTSEVLATWVWNRIKPELSELSWVTVFETVTAGCHYDGEHYRIWKEMRFESAIRLVRAPESDRRSQLHGHSYVTRLHLSAPLDEVMGWTIDYGDVKEVFRPVYKQLDHHPLKNLDGIEDTDTISILHWMRGQVLDSLPQLDRIDLYETPGCGAFLQWGDHGPALPAQYR
jgi:6-pyruvoyltetrahydropterin/6-carboxytetrahydropterin synthase